MTDAVAEQKPVPKSRDGKIRWWDVAIVAIAGTVVGTLLTLLLAAAAIFAARKSGYMGPIPLTTLEKSFPVNIVGLLVNDLGVLGVLWLVARRRFRPLFAHYFAPVRGRAVAFAALSGLALALILNGGDFLLSRAGLVRFTDSDFERAMVPHGSGQFLAAVAVIALFVPFFEELFFRGLLFDWLRRVGGVWVGVLLSAALFSLAHMEILFHPGLQGWVYSVNIFLSGVVLAAWVLRTKSLQTSFAMHAAYNLTGIVASIFLSWP